MLDCLRVCAGLKCLGAMLSGACRIVLPAWRIRVVQAWRVENRGFLSFVELEATLQIPGLKVKSVCAVGSVCLCNSAVHATNLDTLPDLTVLNAAMFSCSHVRFCFQVFLGFEISFF